MNMKLVGLAVAMLVATACTSAEASLAMHRKLAGEAGADGWYLAKSTKGGFSVSLPAQFNDFTVTASKLDNGYEAEIDVVGTQIQDVGKFSASCFRYVGKAPGKDRIIAPFSGQGSTPFKDAYGEGVQLRTEAGHTKVYAIPGRSCLLVVEVYDAAVVTDAVVEQFFSSFEIAGG
jgi:hypothetical protein